MVLQYIFYRSLKNLLKSISEEWFNAIYWSSLLFGIFMMKKWVELSLTSFGTLKYDCVIKTREMFDILPLINNYVTTGSSFFFINPIRNNVIKNS